MGEEHEPIKSHEAEFLRLNKKVDDINQYIIIFHEFVGSTKNELKTISDAIKVQTEQTKAIIELGNSVQNVAREMSDISTEISKLIDYQQDLKGQVEGMRPEVAKIAPMAVEVANLAQKPAKTLMKYWDKAVDLVFVSVVLYVLYVVSSGKLGG